LLKVEVEFGTLRLRGGEVLGNNFSLQAFGNVVVELEFGIECVSSGPGLG
jgi:hypothetical protein